MTCDLTMEYNETIHKLNRLKKFVNYFVHRKFFKQFCFSNFLKGLFFGFFFLISLFVCFAVNSTIKVASFTGRCKC